MEGRLRLYKLRKEYNLTQKDISELLCCSQKSVSRYEKSEHNIPLESLIILCDYFETSLDYMTGRTDVRKPYPKPQKKNSKPAVSYTDLDKEIKRVAEPISYKRTAKKESKKETWKPENKSKK